MIAKNAAISISLFSLILCGATCNKENIVNCAGRADYQLVLTGEEQFPLDTGSTFSPSAAYYVRATHQDSALLFIDNQNQNRIEMYNPVTRQLQHRIQLTGEGVNGIKYKPTSFFPHTADSIFLFFNIGQELLLMNRQGEIINRIGRINTDWTKDNEVPIIQVNGQMKPFVLNNEIHFCTYGQPSTQGMAGAAFDLANGPTTFPYRTPELYDQGWWSGLLYGKFYQVYNPDDDLIVLSYGPDHNIYIKNRDGKMKTVCAKSSYLPDQLVPYSKKKLDFEEHYLELWRHEALQGGYATMIYDQWRKVYYRMAFRPLEEAEYKSPNQLWDKPTIIILDRNFEKVGESILPNGFLFSIFYVSPKGLHFYNKKAYDEVDDDWASFGIFTLNRKL
jgi:hypothetical protein